MTESLEAAQHDRDGLLQTIIDGTPDGIDAKDLNGRYVVVNESVARAVGSTVEQMRGAHYTTILTPEVAAEVALEDQTTLTTGESQSIETTTALDGEMRHYQTLKTPYRNKQGEILGVVSISRDITARKRAEAEQARLYEAEQRARAARDQFLAVASHELKSPLTSLVGYAELLERRASAENGFDERDQRAIRIIAQQTARLARMVNSLFDVARIEEGKLGITRAPVELNALAALVVEQLRLLLKQHTLELVSAEGALLVEGDEIRLEQVLQNLIQNAIKYSPLGGVIRLQVERAENHALLSISDQGIGIPATALPQIFTRFYRAPNAEASHISGLGIGLYVIKQIVQLHGGEIDVTSEEGNGTKFTIRLPLLLLPTPTN